MKIEQDFIIEPVYDLHPGGASSRQYLQLLHESFPCSAMIALRERGRLFAFEAMRVRWQDNLSQWPPANLQIFGQVAFYRMFPSGTQRGIGLETATPESIQQERLCWIKGHILVQDFIRNEVQPTFERITQLNSVLGHKLRQHSLHRKFSCFDVEDLPEANAYFDPWYQELCRRHVWSVQKATLAAAYLISIHPFSNANGRTARLLLDWILGLHGLPPPAFTSRFHAVIGRSPNAWDTPHPLALKRVMDGMENTLRIIQGIDILQEKNLCETLED